MSSGSVHRSEGDGWWYTERAGPPTDEPSPPLDEPLLDLSILSDPHFIFIAAAVFVAQCIVIMVACNWKATGNAKSD